jgi:hypothetical protein
MGLRGCKNDVSQRHVSRETMGLDVLWRDVSREALGRDVSQRDVSRETWWQGVSNARQDDIFRGKTSLSNYC